MRLIRRFPVFVLLALSAPTFAQFNPGPNPITGTETASRALSAGTGTINSGGAISIASGSTVALTMTGTSTLINNGTIQTLGTGRAIDSNSGIANLTLFNNGLISAVSSDAFRVNTNSAVALTNTGTIRVTNGGQAIDWAAISSASNTLTNQASGIITAVGEDAVRPGTGGRVFNYGFIGATPVVSAGAASGSDGIDLRTLTGIQVTNAGTIQGRAGIATDGANAGPSMFTLTNSAGGLVAGLNGSGLNIDGVTPTVTATVVNDFGATIRGGVMAGVTAADGDGIDVDGVLTLTNNGDVLGLGSSGAGNNAEGVAAGGGSITNGATGRIIGNHVAANADVTHAGNGILIDDSNNGNAIAATQIDNAGLIEGTNGFGIKIIGTFADTITNQAGGTIRGTSASATTLQTGGGNDLVINRGAIVNDSGPNVISNAIDLGDGDDQLIVQFSQASIRGNADGGAGTDQAVFDLGNGGVMTYAGVLQNFESVLLDRGRLNLEGSQRISSGTALTLYNGTLGLTNVVGAEGLRLASLDVEGAASLDVGHSSMTFELLAGIGQNGSLTVINWSSDVSPDYAFRFTGDLTSSALFLTLMNATTVNGAQANYFFDGLYTNVNAVPLPGAAVLFGSALAMFGVVRRRRKYTSPARC